MHNLFKSSFQHFKSVVAIGLSMVMVGESVQAAPMGAGIAPASAMTISLPGTLGYISDSYFGHSLPGQKPDVILIQNLHVNRSVQFAISDILKHLKTQNLLPARIAVEGATGPMNVASMQAYPDAAVRKAASDYLVEQGEMPGAMHFVVTEGKGDLYGVETDEIYKANLEVYRRSYEPRMRLKSELDKIEDALPALAKDPALKEKASLLMKDVESVRQLINVQTTPDEMSTTLNRMLDSVERLKRVLPKEVGDSLLDTLSSGTHFYAFALMRNQDLFNNTLVLRAADHQQTTVLITGGFHTQSLADQCKAKGLSYAVITPNVTKMDTVDEKLYVARLLGHHLSPDQVAQGLDWAAMDQLEVIYHTAGLFSSATRAVLRVRRNPLLATAILALTMFIPRGLTQNAPKIPTTPAQPIISLSAADEFIDQQRGHDPHKLPATFRMRPGDHMPRDPEDPTGRATELMVREGIGLYDTAIAIGAETSSEHFKEAKQISELYTEFNYGEDMALEAYPRQENTQEDPNAFYPFDENAFYLFNFTRTTGLYSTDWQFWNAHTGPNAWYVNRVAHYMLMSGDRSPKLLDLLHKIGNGMLRLQDAQTQGGVRYGPKQFHKPGEPDAYDRMNSENEASAFAALHYLYALTGDARYLQASEKIWHWMSEGDVYNSKTRKMQKGMLDPETKMFFVDAVWNPALKRWEIIPESATDSGGTWSISAFGPQRIDQRWGKGTAFQMYKSIRSHMGVTADFQSAGLEKPIAGLDFSEKFPNQRLITREWSKGGENAVDRELEYYRDGAGKGDITSADIQFLENDKKTISAFITDPRHANQYAEGPGMNPPRSGRTGWFWFSAHGDAMAAVYGVLPGDPLDTSNLRIITSNPPARQAQATREVLPGVKTLFLVF